MAVYAPSGFYIASGGKINYCSVNQQPYIILTLKIISLTWHNLDLETCMNNQELF